MLLELILERCAHGSVGLHADHAGDGLSQGSHLFIDLLVLLDIVGGLVLEDAINFIREIAGRQIVILEVSLQLFEPLQLIFWVWDLIVYILLQLLDQIIEEVDAVNDDDIAFDCVELPAALFIGCTQRVDEIELVLVAKT